MPTLISPTDLRTLVETDLTDAALQILLDDADAEIIRRLGALASQQETLPTVGELYLHLTRRAQAVTAAVERVMVGWGNPQEYSLTVANDLKLHSDGYRVERLVAGDNPSTVWRGLVTITYTPIDDTAGRKRLEVDLVKLALQFNGLSGLSIGDVRLQSMPDYQGARDALFRSLASSGRRLIV